MRAGLERLVVKRLGLVKGVKEALWRGEVLDTAPGCKFGMRLGKGTEVVYRGGDEVGEGVDSVKEVDVLAWGAELGGAAKEEKKEKGDGGGDGEAEEEGA